MIDYFLSSERRKFGRQVGRGDLIKTHMLHNILQAPFTHIYKLCSGWQFVICKISRDLGEQDLPTMPGGHDTLGHCYRRIACIAWRFRWVLQLGYASVNSHAYLDGRG